MHNRTVFYDGPSLLTGAPVLGILTGLARRSRNPKTGACLQSWILPRDTDPLAAVKHGGDEAVCGDCPLRPSLGGTCYVNAGHAPSQTWQAVQRGVALAWHDSLRARIAPYVLRLGAYGDPTAIPLDAWLPLLDAARGLVGYTHQWRRADLRWRDYLMASVDSPEERAEAKSWGWRTFRVRSRLQPLERGEIVCPASPEGGQRRTCLTCRACDGAHASPGAVDIAIVEHGSRVPRARWALPLVRS